jgi:hypothetical protein
MGMKAAMGAPLDVPGEVWACFWFRAVETLAARVVLPGCRGKFVCGNKIDVGLFLGVCT